MFEKITSVNFVGSDPRLLEIGAKRRTQWALKLKVKKNKGCQKAGSRGTALWPVPICQKIWQTRFYNYRFPSRFDEWNNNEHIKMT